MAPTVGAVSRSVGVRLATDLWRLSIRREFESLATPLPLEFLPLAPGEAATLAVVENDPDGMEETCDPTVPAGAISFSGHEIDCEGPSYNSQGEELKDEIQ